MPEVCSVGTYTPPFRVDQEDILILAREIFKDSFSDIDRLISVFKNGQILQRTLAVPLDWFRERHTFQERNDLYIELAIKYGVQAIEDCLNNDVFLRGELKAEEIDAIFFISSTGLATPSIEARIMNVLPFSAHTKRIPIWGLGCAGGASGLARAYDYCLAYPTAKVLVLCVELCSLTFLHGDKTKSNLVGSSLFSDGVACALVCGDDLNRANVRLDTIPNLRGSRSFLLPHSEDVMGWNVKDDGLQVVFSRSIPELILRWLKPSIEEFLSDDQLAIQDIQHFVAHPGGLKVLDAYHKALNFDQEMLKTSFDILQQYGNMSSATVLYVLRAFMLQEIKAGECGLLTALGPGFSSELVLLEWVKGGR